MRKDIFIEHNGQRVFSLRKILGKGYDKAWFLNNKVRYRVFCGARSTKKSVDIIGYEPILKILDDERRNIVITRLNDVDNRQSTYENICGRIIDLGLENDFKISKNPMVIEYKATGQQIIFRGLNNPTGLNSLTFAHGYFTDLYIEEAFELSDEADFRKLDGSLRGQLPPGLFFQITLCLNAWDGESWINEVFFKNRLEDDYAVLDDPDVTYIDYYDEEYVGFYGKGLYLHKSTYKINEFRDKEQYDAAAQEMKRVAPEIYKVEFLGMWGNTTYSVYPEFSSRCIKPIEEIIGVTKDNFPIMEFAGFSLGIDTGLSTGDGKKKKILKNEDPNKKIRAATTMTLSAITSDLSKMITIDEYFHTNIAEDAHFNTDNQNVLELPQQADALLNQIIEWIKMYGNNSTILMKGTIPIYVDSADPGFRQVMEMKAREYGMFNLSFYGSTKLSIQTRVDFDRLMMAYGEFIIVDHCKNLIREIKNMKKGKKGEPRTDGNDHTKNADEYGKAPLLSSLKRWKTFKEH